MLTINPINYSFIAPLYDTVYNKILADGHQQIGKFLRTKRSLPGFKVLELGVGSGLSLAYLPTNVDYTGIDINEKMLSIAKKKAAPFKRRKINLALMDAHSLKFRPASFDLVIAASVITAVKNPHQVIKEAIRMTRKGGHIAIIGNFRRKESPTSQLIKKMDPFTRTFLGFRTDLQNDTFNQYKELKMIDYKRVNNLLGLPLSSYILFQRK
jgi:phosphatidylethanolamine/phosphatidyl-N-methylethanolamine N-methyltransferase